MKKVIGAILAFAAFTNSVNTQSQSLGDGKYIKDFYDNVKNKNTQLYDQLSINNMNQGHKNVQNNYLRVNNGNKNNENKQEKPCIGKRQQNLIINGDFQQNECKFQKQWCNWKKNKFVPSYVPGWIPSPEIQIVKRSHYNLPDPNNIVADLDGDQNTCIKQKVKLHPGKYNLQFDWMGNPLADLSSSAFALFLNDALFKQFNPAEIKMVTEKILIQVTKDQKGQSEISFCGTGQADLRGAIIDNVKLFYLDGCPKKF